MSSAVSAPMNRADDQRLSLMRFTLYMTFKSIVVTTLFLAHLTIILYFLQAFRLDLIGNRFCGHRLMLAHLKKSGE